MSWHDNYEVPTTDSAMDRLDPWPARSSVIDDRFPNAVLSPMEVPA